MSALCVTSITLQKTVTSKYIIDSRTDYLLSYLQKYGSPEWGCTHPYIVAVAREIIKWNSCVLQDWTEYDVRRALVRMSGWLK